MSAEPAGTPPHEIALREDRTLRLLHDDAEDVVEIVSDEGTIELRVRLTPQGPVLEMDAVRLKLKASENVDVECRNFRVRAQRGVDLDGKDVRVTGDGDVRVTGKMIYLN